MKRKFEVTFTVTAKIELDEAVITAVDDEWRSQFYNLRDVQDIAEHIAYNLLQGNDLSRLDGWADQPDKNAVLLDEEWELDEVEVINEDAV